jgi:hypothetical protein
LFSNGYGYVCDADDESAWDDIFSACGNTITEEHRGLLPPYKSCAKKQTNPHIFFLSRNMPMSKNTVTVIDNKTVNEIELPFRQSTLGPEAVDIGSFFREPGYFTYDPGFLSTARIPVLI